MIDGLQIISKIKLLCTFAWMDTPIFNQVIAWSSGIYWDYSFVSVRKYSFEENSIYTMKLTQLLFSLQTRTAYLRKSCYQLSTQILYNNYTHKIPQCCCISDDNHCTPNTHWYLHRVTLTCKCMDIALM